MTPNLLISSCSQADELTIRAFRSSSFTIHYSHGASQIPPAPPGPTSTLNESKLLLGRSKQGVPAGRQYLKGLLRNSSLPRPQGRMA